MKIKKSATKSLLKATAGVMAITFLAACSGGGKSAEEIEAFAIAYAVAWNSGDPSQLAAMFEESGSAIVNGAAPITGRAALTEMAADLMNSFPDMTMETREVIVTETGAEYHWRFFGTNTGPGGTGAGVDFNGYEEWTFGENGLIQQAVDYFDEADFAAQINAPRVISVGSSADDIVAHMLAHERNQTLTDSLASALPGLSREDAYEIQQHRLNTTSSADNPHVGWKLGWTRMEDPGTALDPIVGHYLQSRVFPIGTPISTSGFTEGSAAAEPEIVFYLGEDLPGPVVTREQVLAAIESVGIAMEFVNWRVAEPNRTREYAVVDNGIAAGVVLGERRFDVATLNFSEIEGTVTVNSAETSSGSSTSIMGRDPVAGLVWAANELPKYGMHLKAGEFVVSGTVCPPLPVAAGDSATIAFTGLGSVSATFVE